MCSWARSPSVREVPGYPGWGWGEGATSQASLPSRHGKVQGTEAWVSRDLGMKLVSVPNYSVARSKFPSLPVPGTAITIVSLGPWSALKDLLGVLATAQATQLLLLV